MLRLVHQQQSLSWPGAAAPGQKSARDEAVLELSCWRSTGSHITIVLRPVCMFVGWCGIFHVIPFLTSGHETDAKSRISLQCLCLCLLHKYRHAFILCTLVIFGSTNSYIVCVA